MKKLTWIFFFVLLISIAGCAPSDVGSDRHTEETETPATASSKQGIKIKELEISVFPDVGADLTKTLAFFRFKNNSPYTITSFDLRYVAKKDATSDVPFMNAKYKDEV